MDLGILLRTMQVMILNSRNSSEHCSNTGRQVAQFCTEGQHVFSTDMYIGAKNMTNKATECFCSITSPERVPLFISLVGASSTSDCEARLKVIGDKRFTIDCYDDVHDGDVAMVFPHHPTTIRFIRTDKPTDMCTKYFVAFGSPNVTIKCYKDGFNPMMTLPYASTNDPITTPLATQTDEGSSAFTKNARTANVSSVNPSTVGQTSDDILIYGKAPVLFGAVAGSIVLLAIVITMAIMCRCKERKVSPAAPDVIDREHPLPNAVVNGHIKLPT